jgi:hypothetical protein
MMPYPTNARGDSANINYAIAPAGDSTGSFSSTPATPLLTAYAGDPVVVHELVAPGSEQAHVFGLGGLTFHQDPFIPNSDIVANQGIGPSESYDANIIGGAGGRTHDVGDFFYGDLRKPFVQIGAWGIQRVLPKPANCASISVGEPLCLQ